MAERAPSPDTTEPVPPIFHIAQAEHWAAAVADPAQVYEWSTLGRTLAQEGFIHASDAHQWEATLARFYAGHDGPLLLLTIDPTRLTAPLLREVGNPVTGERFPHIHGPLNLDAVVATRPLQKPTS